MLQIPPHIVARWISEGIQDIEFVRLRLVIEQILKEHVTQSEEEISETAEEFQHKIYDSLCRIQEEQKQHGVEPTFTFDSSTGDIYIKSSNREAINILNKLIGLSPEGFEVFCAKVLSALGANGIRVGGVKDGGIDFIGYGLPVSNISTPALYQSSPLVIGQAKRYKAENLISVHDLRSFLGAGLISSDRSIREQERYGLFSPVVYAFWTTSDFNHDAHLFAIQSGMWHLNGIALAQLTIRLKIHIN